MKNNLLLGDNMTIKDGFKFGIGFFISGFTFYLISQLVMLIVGLLVVRLM